MTRHYASMFTGGDLAGWGLRAAGYASSWGVECADAIADVAEANGSRHLIRARVEDVDYARLERPDLLWASPVCKNASQAKTNGRETPEDLASADAICRALETLTPPTFVLENVIGYRQFKSFVRIVATLDRLGYMTDVRHINAADMGVPQTRRRLILRAVRGGLVPHLLPPVAWTGWLKAIEDLLPTLPESRFAAWQLARLEPLSGHTLVHPTEMRAMTTRAGDEPAFTLTAVGHGMAHNPTPYPRAFLASAQSVAGGQPTLREGDDLSVTVGTNGDRMRAFLVGGGNTQLAKVDSKPRDRETGFTVAAHAGKQAARAWLEQGRVVSMTPRALARFQSVPDSYALPESRTLACTIIGNGVPCLLAKAIGESLLSAIK